MYLIDKILFVIFALFISILLVYLFTFADKSAGETVMQIIGIFAFILVVFQFLRKKE